jgi:uncharacterized membrane protein YeaQ/YmgE (transglycosylase-associated protein family)
MPAPGRASRMDHAEVLLIGGRAGVGKTTVGWEVSARLHGAEPGCGVGNYAELGYRRLVYTNTVAVLDDAAPMFRRAMRNGVRLVRVLLTATDETTEQRLTGRELGSELEHEVRSSARKARLLGHCLTQGHGLKRNGLSLPPEGNSNLCGDRRRRGEMEISGIISAIVIGLIIGVLGRLVVPGRQRIGVLWTILVGIVAALIGSAIAAGLDVADTDGVDWVEWLIQIGLAALGVVTLDRAKARR